MVDMYHVHTSKVAGCIPTVRLLLLLLLILVGHDSQVHAQQHDVQIVTSDDEDHTRKIVETLRKTFPFSQVITNPRHYIRTDSTIVIAVGPSALRSVLAQGSGGVVVSAFTSSLMYHTIMEKMPRSDPPAITAIYAEPAPAIQFQLISMLYKKRVSVVAILGSKSSYLTPILQQAASQTSTPLHIENYAETENINRVLNRIADYQAILATPDSALYSPGNIRNILLTTYRRNQPIIGFSAGLVKIGTLASAYSDIEDISAQIEEVVSAFKASGKLPEPQFPKYYSVVVNEDVARSLNIVVDNTVRQFSQKPATRKP